LIKAAQAVSVASPAYLTARYNLIRLLIEQKNIDAARVAIDAPEVELNAKMPPSSRCLFMTQKSQMARNFDEYWQDVLQVTAEASDNAPDSSASEMKKIDNSNGYTRGPTCFTADGAKTLNSSVPLRLLASMVNSVHLDKNVRRDCLQAVWTRAVMLGDLKAASAITPTLAATAPALTASLRVFTEASTLEEKRFVLACIALQNPAMRPYITGGAQRSTAFDKIDDYHNNWWCRGGISEYYSDGLKEKIPRSMKMDFLSAADFAAASSEFDKLCALGPGPDYLLDQVINWAAKHPQDPRLPAALSRAISSPKFGCGTKLANALSKKAFAILHANFPNDHYSKKSKFWY
jgi:hypothetical protein